MQRDATVIRFGFQFHLDITVNADGPLVHVQIEKRLNTDTALRTFPDEEFGDAHKLAWMILAARETLNDS